MNSNLFRLDSNDFIKGLFVAVLTPVVAAFAEALQVPGFDFTSYNWKTLVALGVSAGLTYLAKNFLSDKDGAILGYAVGRK